MVSGVGTHPAGLPVIAGRKKIRYYPGNYDNTAVKRVLEITMKGKFGVL